MPFCFNVMTMLFVLLALTAPIRMEPVKSLHQTISNAPLQTMLIGANLDARFWPYTFQTYLRIKNALPLKDQSSSPDLLQTSIKPDFTALHTFGC
jgi:hypothetical protein